MVFSRENFAFPKGFIVHRRFLQSMPVEFTREEQVTDEALLGEFRDEKGRYQHPQNGRNEFWYTCAVRRILVYLCFERPCMSQDTIRFAMRYALENNLNAIKVLQTNATRWKTEFSACEMIPLHDGAFNADYRTVDFTELTIISSLTPNIDIVEFEGTKYVHKFMRKGSFQSCWETEFQRYIQFQHCENVPSLIAVVKRDGMIRGLLISFIDGDNLGEVVITSETELLGITYQIISVAAGLEKVAGYYNSDLKCQNILRRRSDYAIYFVDFAGGFTDGFFPETSLDKLCRGEVDPKDGIYILGKTLWQLWTSTIPVKELADSIPEPARSIIYDCCIGRKFNSIEDLQKAYPSDFASRELISAAIM